MPTFDCHSGHRVMPIDSKFCVRNCHAIFMNIFRGLLYQKGLSEPRKSPLYLKYAS